MIKLYKITIYYFFFLKDVHNITLEQNVQILPIIQTKINYHSKTNKQKKKQKKKSGWEKQIRIVHSISRGCGKEKVINQFKLYRRVSALLSDSSACICAACKWNDPVNSSEEQNQQHNDSR